MMRPTAACQVIAAMWDGTLKGCRHERSKTSAHLCSSSHLNVWGCAASAASSIALAGWSMRPLLLALCMAGSTVCTWALAHCKHATQHCVHPGNAEWVVTQDSTRSAGHFVLCVCSWAAQKHVADIRAQCRAVIVLEDIDTVGLESRGRSKGDKAGSAEDGKAPKAEAPAQHVQVCVCPAACSPSRTQCLLDEDCHVPRIMQGPVGCAGGARTSVHTLHMQAYCAHFACPCRFHPRLHCQIVMLRQR